MNRSRKWRALPAKKRRKYCRAKLGSYNASARDRGPHIVSKPTQTLIAADVYAKLRHVAAQMMRRERRSHTLQATAVVHEAYIRLARQACFDTLDEAHFLSLAAATIRRVLLDHARRSAAQRRGARLQRTHFVEALQPAAEPEFDPLIFEEALSRLERRDALKAQIVQLRFFVGLPMEEIAHALRVSERTVAHEWEFARAWLRQELSYEHESDPASGGLH